jgi:hypothetical protein
MTESPPVPPVSSTFVVRFWKEWSAAGPHWRGRIEHVQSGESAAFLGLDGMLDFIRSFGAMADDASRPVEKDGVGGSGTTMG